MQRSKQTPPPSVSRISRRAFLRGCGLSLLGLVGINASSLLIPSPAEALSAHYISGWDFVEKPIITVVPNANLRPQISILSGSAVIEDWRCIYHHYNGSSAYPTYFYPLSYVSPGTVARARWDWAAKGASGEWLGIEARVWLYGDGGFSSWADPDLCCWSFSPNPVQTVFRAFPAGHPEQTYSLDGALLSRLGVWRYIDYDGVSVGEIGVAFADEIRDVWIKNDAMLAVDVPYRGYAHCVIGSDGGPYHIEDPRFRSDDVLAHAVTWRNVGTEAWFVHLQNHYGAAYGFDTRPIMNIKPDVSFKQFELAR